MAHQRNTTEGGDNAVNEIHTPGGMADPAAKHGRATEEARDLASTDTTQDYQDRVQPPDPSITAPPGTPKPTDAGQAGQDAGAEWRDRHLRLAAEFDNYKKRVARERVELSDRAQAGFVGRLLDVLDDLDRLVATGPETSIEALREGLTLVDRKLRKELESAGVERIDPTGQPFDPSQQEAVSIVPAPSPDRDHQVSATFQVGYRFKGALVRPARVQVFSTQGNA